MPIWSPEWMSAAASSALMMRLARLEFRTREVVEAAAVDIDMSASQSYEVEGLPITIEGMVTEGL